MTYDEVKDLCGGLTQPARQLRLLHASGYSWRATSALEP